MQNSFSKMVYCISTSFYLMHCSGTYLCTHMSAEYKVNLILNTYALAADLDQIAYLPL